MKKPTFTLSKLSTHQKNLRKRILEITHRSRLSHLGSCLSAIDAIDAAYQTKQKKDRFVLSNGHAGIALYTILEHYGHITNPSLTESLHIHPDRNEALDIHVSTGSLGQGLPIALGMALGNPKQTIYCMLSDGECAEGSIWESLRIATENHIKNLKIIIIANGWGAYDAIDINNLKKRIRAFGCIVSSIDGHNITTLMKAFKKKTKNVHVIFAKTIVEQFPFLEGQDAHYYVMQEKDYKNALELL